MKRIFCLILLCVVMASAVSCSEDEVAGGVTATVPKVFNSMEYTIYMNIFQSGQGSSYTEKTYTKDGVFSILYDRYNDKTRYYVWGYSDETLCCDWQWEFVPDNADALPPIGSRVKVTGTLVQSDGALHGYWMEGASVETVISYESAIGELDTVTMSSTLARVQIINIVNHATEYDGKPIRIYGRVMSGNRLQHPYYDNMWSLPLDYEDSLPAIGTWITVTGTFSGSSAEDSKVTVRNIAIDG